MNNSQIRMLWIWKKIKVIFRIINDNNNLRSNDLEKSA